MSNTTAIHFDYDPSCAIDALVVGRAGLDLYPEPDGKKIEDAVSFSTDLGGSAGNIAVAIAQANASVGIVSSVSDDAVGKFVTKRLQKHGVDISLLNRTEGNARTSLALAEVCQQDCQVVIYRNNAADLHTTSNDAIQQKITQCSNLIVTGTCLIEASSREHTLAMMRHANQVGCHVWFDLDYRAWNWPSLEITRQVYNQAAALSQVLIGNEEEFAVFTDDLDAQISHCQHRQQVLILKRGAVGSSIFAGKARLDSGIYPLQSLKPYGAGDAFLGNLVVNYMHTKDWSTAVMAGSAAAAIVVSTRGCASAMPTPEQVNDLQQNTSLTFAASWR